MANKVEEIFEQLYRENTNSPEYCLLQGELYEFLENDTRADTTDAMETARYLNNGQVETAEEYVDEVLNPDE